MAGAGRAGRPASGRAGGGAGDRRHGAAEEGHALGGRGAAVLWPARQAGQLPSAGLADAGWAGGAVACGAAAVPARGVEPRSGALRSGRRAGGRGGGPTKGAIALAELDRLIAAGVRFGLMLADAGYGASAVFRHGLSERGLTWAVGIPRNQKVYAADVELIPPTGRKRRPAPTRSPERPGRCWRTCPGAR